VVSSRQAHSELVVLVAVLDVPSSASAGYIVLVTFAIYIAVAVSAAVTLAANNFFRWLFSLIVICAHCHCCCHCCLHHPPLALPLPIIRDSNLIGVNNFAIHTVIFYLTGLTDIPTLDQIYIAGGSTAIT
jgi:hypothetical protein